MSDPSSAQPPVLTLTRDVMVANSSSLYLGSNLDDMLPNITYQKLDSYFYAVHKDQPTQKMIFRTIALVDDHFPFLSYSANLNTTHGKRAPENAKYSAFLRMVPPDYAWARVDWPNVCKNLAAVQEAAGSCFRFQTATSCVYEDPNRKLLKITLPLFVHNTQRRKEGKEPEYTFKDWPKKSSTIPLLERVDALKIWDINPLPLYEHVEGRWFPVCPESYNIVKGSLIDIEFAIAFTVITISGKEEKKKASEGPELTSQVFEGKARNGRKLTFWAVPVAIRILDPSASMQEEKDLIRNAENDALAKKRAAPFPAADSERRVKQFLTSPPSSSSASSMDSFTDQSSSQTSNTDQSTSQTSIASTSPSSTSSSPSSSKAA